MPEPTVSEEQALLESVLSVDEYVDANPCHEMKNEHNVSAEEEAFLESVLNTEEYVDAEPSN